jgi:spore maturation protein CgeB
MRIFCAVRHSTDLRFYYGGLWSGNFYPALRQLGHQVVESDVDLLPASRFMHIAGHFNQEELATRSEITQRIIDEVTAAHRKEPIDLFLSYFYNSHFDPGGFDELRHLGIPSVNFYCNSIYQFDLVKDIAAKADVAWHAERDARPRYVAAGANPVYVQMGADPTVYHPVPATRQPNACFVGLRYADRDRWVAALIKANVPVIIYGPGWGRETNSIMPNQNRKTDHLGRQTPVAGTRSAFNQAIMNWREEGFIQGNIRTWRQFRYRAESRRLAPLFTPFAKGSVPFDQQKTIFSSSEVVLNFSNVWADGRPGSPLIPHVRLRDFEAPMCGSCYLTGHTDEIEQFYEIGKEIDTYETPEELVDKVQFYLSHSDAAEKLRNRGFQRAVQSHTWRHRFEELFAKISGVVTDRSRTLNSS